MKHTTPRRDGKVMDLVGSLCRDQLGRAEQVERESRLLISTLATSAEVTQTISNIRLQRFLTLVSIVSVAVAVVALIIALHSGTSP